jgi:uncharacterized protein YjdB
MKTCFNVIVVALLAIMCMFSLTGCPKEPADLTPTYIEIGGDTAITSIDQTLTFTAAEAMSWSLKGCNNGDNDANNDITYDASNKLTIVPSADGKSATVALKDGYIPSGSVETARVFATLKSDTYRYGYKDITITVGSLFSYDLTGVVGDMSAPENKPGTFEPVKDHGERAEQYIDGLYYYSDANGFMDGDDEGGIQFNYYAVGGLGRGYSTATTKTNRTDKEDSSGVTYTPNLVSPIKSYIAVDAEDMTTTATNVKLYISAKAKAGTAPVLAVLSDNVDDTDITNVTRYLTVIEEKALTEEKAFYSFVVPANKKVIIANDSGEGPNMFVYDIIGYATEEAVPALVPAVNSVEVTASNTTIQVKKSVTAKAAVAGVDGANKAVTWSSSDDTIATVDAATGKVTGVAVGPVTITATSVFDATKTDSIEITVDPEEEKFPVAGVTYYYDFKTAEFTDDEGTSLDSFFTWKQYEGGHAKGHGMRVYGNDTYWTIKVAGSVKLTVGCCQYNNSASGKISIYKGDTLLTEVTGDGVDGGVLDSTEEEGCNNKKYSYDYEGEATTLTFKFNQKDYYYESLTVAPLVAVQGVSFIEDFTAWTIGDTSYTTDDITGDWTSYDADAACVVEYASGVIVEANTDTKVAKKTGTYTGFTPTVCLQFQKKASNNLLKVPVVGPCTIKIAFNSNKKRSDQVRTLEAKCTADGATVTPSFYDTSSAGNEKFDGVAEFAYAGASGYVTFAVVTDEEGNSASGGIYIYGIAVEY